MFSFSVQVFCVSVAIQHAVCWAGDTSAAGGALREKINPKELTEVWKHLANESMMFPMRMADVAAKIGPEHQLFVDNYLIAETSNITREVHHPKRSKENPMLDDQTVWYLQHVMMFDEPPRFRMWYNPAVDFHYWKENEQIRFVTAYAVSDNGMHWRRPDLDLYKIPKYPYGNVVLPYGMMQGLFHEPWETDPSKRFKALVCVEARNTLTRKFTIPEGYYLHTSPDGIHWNADLEHMLIPSLASYKIPQTGIGDTSRFWWDSIRGKYMGDVKWVLPGKLRCRGMMQSDDLIHWSRPHPTFFATEPNIQIYGHAAMTYEGMYIGFRWLTPTNYFWKDVHAIELGLDCSRDGVIWTRVGIGQLFMKRKNTDRKTYDAPHAWDADQMAARSAFVVGDEIWLYYNGGGSVGLAKLRLDGFASLNAGEMPGTVVTRPLSFSGRKLFVNAEVAQGGSVKVTVCDLDTKPLENYGPGDCIPVTTDTLHGRVKWRQTEELPGNTASAIQKHVRLRFDLKNAKLYSFWIE